MSHFHLTTSMTSTSYEQLPKQVMKYSLWSKIRAKRIFRFWQKQDVKDQQRVSIHTWNHQLPKSFLWIIHLCFL